MQKKNISLQVILICCLCFLVSCANDDDEETLPTPPISCEGTMFGMPIDATGLSDSLCRPVCECKNFTSKNFTETQLQTLRSWTLTEAYEELTTNPYEENLTDSTAVVCAIVVEDLPNKRYHLESFPSVEEAEKAGAILTHHDACGLCSTLEDFAVYAKERDIGALVQQCALSNLIKPFDSLLVCVEAIGFSRPCAQIWAYNAKNTQTLCLQSCLEAVDQAYHLEDGSLNECLACDEENSGPVFKAVAGRTRRNTGLASSICRPCEEVRPVEHEYPF